MHRQRWTAAVALSLALSLALAAGAPCAAGAQLFFNGDATGGGYASWVNHPTNSLNQVVFDRFHVPVGQSWTASAVFADFAQFDIDPAIGTLFWQVRTGMSVGAGVGTVVASGSGAATVAGDRYTVAVAPFVLGPGDYWLGMYGDLTGVPDPGDPSRDPFIGPRATDGTNGVNAALDGRSLWLIGPDAGLDGGSVNEIAFDISYGMYGQAVVSAVPEPGTWALLATGLVGIAGVARRRR